MGQYQQWLHYREIDQDLQAQLEMLERDLAQLFEHTYLLEQSIQPLHDNVSAETSSVADQEILQGDNQIIHALADSLNGQLSSMVNMRDATFTPMPTPLPETLPNEPAETTSPALFGWANLPNFEPQVLPLSSLPPVPHSDMPLLPEDMGTFFDQHDQTDPQLELPRWLRNAINHPDGPIDWETIRTNRLVQRWIQRWNRHTASQGRTTNE